MSALTTHTFGNHREKEKEKKQIKRNFNKRSKAENDKEQDHLKKTSLGPLRQGQRLNTSETKPCSSKEHKPPKQTRAPPAHMQAPPEQVPTLGTNRSGRFPKPVRPVPPKPVRTVSKTGQADFTQQTTPPDEVISTSFAQSQVNQGHDIRDVTLEQEQLNIGPITRSRAKKLQQQVTSLLAEFKIHANENCLLPKSCTFIVLRFTHKDMDDTQEEKGYV
jgi:hypothetical protein